MQKNLSTCKHQYQKAVRFGLENHAVLLDTQGCLPLLCSCIKTFKFLVVNIDYIIARFSDAIGTEAEFQTFTIESATNSQISEKAGSLLETCSRINLSNWQPLIISS